MSLTEEERELITWMREDADKWLDACWDADTERPRKVLTLCNLIDRLLAENEGLQSDKNRLLGIAQILQAKLDAIKKAWEPFVKFLNAVLVKQGDEPDELPMLGMGRSVHDVPTMGEVRALNRLI